MCVSPHPPDRGANPAGSILPRPVNLNDVCVVCWDVDVIGGPRDLEADVSHSFGSVHRREIVALTALASVLTGSEALGEELAQEALLRMYRDWHRVRDMERPGAWARRVLLNLVADARRRRRRERGAMARLAARQEGQDASPPQDEQFWAAVRALPELQRHVVVLRYVDDLSVASIAGVLGVADGTVKTSLFRARRALAAHFDCEEADDAED